MKLQLPGQHVLILSAVCLSIIGSVGAYKYAEYQKTQALLHKGGVVASATTSTSSAEYTKNRLSIQDQIELANIKAKASSTNPFLPSENDTLSDRLSKNVFYSYLQYQNGDLDAAGQAEIAQKVVSSIDTSQLPGEKYTLANIKMYAPKNQAQIKAYGNAVAQIRNKYFLQVGSNPEYYQKNMAQLADIFSKTGEELINIQVPTEVAVQHLNIVNTYIRIAENFKIILNQSKDPLKAVLALKIFKEDYETQTEMYTEIGTYFTKNGILFDTNEPGASIWPPSTAKKS